MLISYIAVSLSVETVRLHKQTPSFNPLMGTLKPHRNGRLYSNTVISTLAVDGLLQLIQRQGAWEGCGPVPSSLYQM